MAELMGGKKKNKIKNNLFTSTDYSQVPQLSSSLASLVQEPLFRLPSLLRNPSAVANGPYVSPSQLEVPRIKPNTLQLNTWYCNLSVPFASRSTVTWIAAERGHGVRFPGFPISSQGCDFLSAVDKNQGWEGVGNVFAVRPLLSLKVRGSNAIANIYKQDPRSTGLLKLRQCLTKPGWRSLATAKSGRSPARFISLLFKIFHGTSSWRPNMRRSR